MSAARFARAAVASPHHLATAAGERILRDGGNALDAAIATNLVLGVVAPYLCGYGGDLFALVWRDGPYAYNGSGRAPADADPSGLGDAMPTVGPATVTVPGAVAGWFDLLERFGSASFASLAEAALGYAREGFTVSELGASTFARAAASYPADSPWHAIYGGARAGEVLLQPALARTIDALVAGGRGAYYRGPVADAIVEHLGGWLSAEDLATHAGDWVEPLHGMYRGAEVLELPPNTQGVTALQAMRLAQTIDARDDHLLIEAMKRALADRDAFVGDPASMAVSPSWLLDDERIVELAETIDPERAAVLPPGGPVPGGTAYLCAADDEGMLVSLIQSNFMGFGSGETVAEWGINLHNRGASFRLDPSHPNALGPAKRPMHTLIPALALREGVPWLAFGTMGGHGQAQTHLQLLHRVLVEGADIQEAIDAPRWFVSPDDWSVVLEDGSDPARVEALRARGHVLHPSSERALFGHAHAIEVLAQGYAAATDPRTEGAVGGL